MNLGQFNAELQEAFDKLADFSKFIHLFSEDEGKRTLAELRQTLGRLQSQIHLVTIKEVKFGDGKVLRQPSQPTLVQVRPVGDEYGGKTFVGFLLGDIATGLSVSIEETFVEPHYVRYNPAIYIPEIGKVIFGYESWWGEIESIEDLKAITNEDIENLWYVKYYKHLLEKEKAA